MFASPLLPKAAISTSSPLRNIQTTHVEIQDLTIKVRRLDPLLKTTNYPAGASHIHTQ
jgi:hypothetical protein